MLKYTIFPSLYSIGDEGEAVNIIKREIDDVMHSYNRSSSTYLSYFTAITALHATIASLKSNGADPTGSDFATELFRGVDDSDHLIFLSAFVPPEIDESFASGLVKHSDEMSDEEASARYIFANRFASLMDGNPEVIVAHAFQMLSQRIQDNRIQCKEFLVTLSAVSSKMQQRASNFSSKKAYEDLSSESFFDIKGTIR
ncbi:hypothetical protein [Pseudomonas putida]|uniref:hypothetical protein n=1 Tax=Pseudomonas putida TaxID=303 RepID=UPI003571664A